MEYYETGSLETTDDWQHVQKEFLVPEDANVEYLACQLVGKGTAWFDDISLEEIKE